MSDLANCAVCQRPFPRRRQDQRTCRRGHCKRTWNSNKERRKRVRRLTVQRHRESEFGPMVYAGIAYPSACTCGQELLFGSDPRTGASLMYCPRCGEAPMPTQGKRSHDQRARLEAEIAQRVEIAQAPADPRKRLGRSHKQKGITVGKAAA